MGYNHIKLSDGRTLIDLREDTITPQDVRAGITFHGADGEKHTGEMGAEEVSPLPEGYTQVAYIKSTGTQYINTGYKPKYNTRLVMGMKGLGQSATWILGAKNNNKATETKQFALFRLDANTIRYDYFGGKTVSFDISDASAYTVVDLDGNKATMFGETLTTTAATSGAVDYNLTLFTSNATNDFTRTKAAIEVDFCQIYDGDTLVRDYIPCVTASGEAGLYDLVGAEFYGNDGTGEFEVPTGDVSISVSSSGLITATAGDDVATKQLPTKAGTTITPSSSVQTAIAAGTFATGDIKVAAASSGKRVYNGTYLPIDLSGNALIHVLLELESSDTFVMFINPSSKNKAVGDKSIVACIKSPSTTRVICALSDGELYINYSIAASITFSGTSVNINSGDSGYVFAVEDYTWYAIKG